MNKRNRPRGIWIPELARTLIAKEQEAGERKRWAPVTAHNAELRRDNARLQEQIQGLLWGNYQLQKLSAYGRVGNEIEEQRIGEAMRARMLGKPL